MSTTYHLGATPRNDCAPAGIDGTGRGDTGQINSTQYIPHGAVQQHPDPLPAFRQAMADAGLPQPDTITPDGDLHRFHVDGDRPGTKNGWYVLHLNGLPAGAAGSWRTGQTVTWCAKRHDRLTAGDRARIDALVAQARRQRQAEQDRVHSAAAARAAWVWDRAQPALFHDYLARKGVLPFGTRVTADGRLIVPIRDGETITSLQFIAPDGEKRFLTGGRISGCWFAIDSGKRPCPVVICEGFATGATLHQETGAPVIVAFNAGNLAPVARKIRHLHPQAEIIIAADNDAWSSGNPGLSKARSAALEIRAKLLAPDFSGMDVSGRPTDWNDWYSLRHQGRQGVAA